jgi:hypothetical protein
VANRLIGLPDRRRGLEGLELAQWRLLPMLLESNRGTPNAWEPLERLTAKSVKSELGLRQLRLVSPECFT